jgi:hypothetical protein
MRYLRVIPGISAMVSAGIIFLKRPRTETQGLPL